MSTNANFPAAQSGSTQPPATGALSGSDLNALVTAAQAEGEVVVYSFTSRIARVEAAFEATYPGINFVGLDISSTQQITRIKAEQGAGLTEVDVAYLSDAPVVYGELIQTGILERFVPPQFADRVPDMFEQPLLANRISTKVLMYNEQAYPNGSPIQNLWQLTLPEWRSKVVMVDPLVRDDYLDLMTELVIRSGEMAAAYEQQFGQPITLGDGVQNAGEQWIRALFGNDVVLVNDTDTVNAAVGALEQAAPPVGFTSYSDRRDNAEEGWALQIANDVAPTPGIAFPALLGIVKNAPHPSAARLVIHFMMGDDTPTGGPGYEPFYVPGDYATRTDITPHPDAVPPGQFRAWFIDPQRTYQIRQQVADLILTLQ
ncbi:MAG: ABC transporter substrate-binding protein [Chloroflexales bacterium]|nr:ABC transporter substrate-binding protein [Chloroflexales bacterium]